MANLNTDLLSPGQAIEATVAAYNSKDAIEKINGLQASASEIDAVVDGEFNKNIKIDNKVDSTAYGIDLRHRAGQGVNNTYFGFVLHNYTDSKAMQLDNVGSGDILRLKNAHNSNLRIDKDDNFVGTGNFLVLEDSKMVSGVEINTIPFRIDNEGTFRWQTKTAVLRQTKTDDSSWGFNLVYQYPHRYFLNIANLVTFENYSGYITTSYANKLRIQTSGVTQIEADSTSVKFLNNVDMSNLPTIDPKVANRLWNDNGILKISLGLI